jgi:hypothetical protein
MSAPEDLVTYLAANNGDVTAGTDLFACEPRLGSPYPAECVFVWSSVGGNAEPYLGTGNYDTIPVQVRVRSKSVNATIGAYQTTRTLARTLKDLAHKATIAGYVSVIVREPEPYQLPTREGGMAEFGFNVVMTRHRAD